MLHCMLLKEAVSFASLSSLSLNLCFHYIALPPSHFIPPVYPLSISSSPISFPLPPPPISLTHFLSPSFLSLSLSLSVSLPLSLSLALSRALSSKHVAFSLQNNNKRHDDTTDHRNDDLMEWRRRAQTEEKKQCDVIDRTRFPEWTLEVSCLCNAPDAQCRLEIKLQHKSKRKPIKKCNKLLMLLNYCMNISSGQPKSHSCTYIKGVTMHRCIDASRYLGRRYVYRIVTQVSRY